MGTVLIAVIAGGALVFGLRWATSVARHSVVSKNAPAQRNRVFEVGAFRDGGRVGIRWEHFDGSVEQVALHHTKALALARLIIECCDRAEKWEKRKP